MIWAFFLISLLVHTLAHASQTYYVDKATGSDSAPCTSARQKSTPRASINAGLACLAPGDTLAIADGAYDELLVGQVDSTTACQSSLAQIQTPCHALPNGVSPEQPTRLVATGGNAVVSPRGRDFPGGGGAITLFDTSRHLHFEGLRLVTNEASGSASGFVGGNAQYVTLTRTAIDAGAIKSSSSSRFFTVTHNTVLDAGKGCDQSTNPYPFCSHGMYLCGTDHVITDNVVERAAYYGIQVSCEQGGIARIRLERNTVKYSYGVGIRCGGTDCLIGANLLVGNGTAITMSGSGVVAHNTIDSYTQGKGDPWGIYLTYGTWANWQVVNNVLTRQKSSFYAIGDAAFSTPDAAKVHHNLCDQSGNAGCTLSGSVETVYTNADQGDYTLRRARTNPAIGTGVPVASVPTDLRGRPYHGATPSVGAYALDVPTPEPPEPPTPGALVLACEGTVEAVPGKVALTCVQQTGGRR